MFKLNMKVARAVVVLTSVVFLGACQLWSQGEDTSLQGDLAAKNGHLIEEFIPKDTPIVLSIKVQSEEHQANFNKLLAAFSTNPMDLLQEAIDEAATESELELTYANIKSMLGEDSRIVVGIVDIAKELPVPNIYIGVQISDVEAFDDLMKKMEEKDLIKKKEDYYVDTTTEDTFVKRMENIVILTTYADNLANIDKLHENENSLLANQLYVDSVNQVGTESWGTLYLDVQSMVEFAQTEFPLAIKQIFNSALYQQLQSETIAVTPEAEGLRLKVFVKTDPDHEGQITFSDFVMKDNLLAKKLSGHDLILFSEGYNLKEFGTLMLSQVADSETILVDLENIKEEIKAQTGLDPEEDILALFDSNYAFSINHNGFLPGITLAFEVSQHEESAKQLMELIDSGITAGLATAGEEYADVVVKDTVEVAGKELHRLSLDKEKLPDEVKLQAELVQELFDLAFYYGVTGDGVMIFSIDTGLPEAYGQNVVADNADWQDLARHLTDDFVVSAYFSMDEAVNLIDDMVALIETKQPLAPSDLNELENIKAYLAPIKGFVSGAKISGEDVFGELFIKIQK